MGGGRWDATTYSASASTRAASGAPAFGYSASVHSSSMSSWKAHDDLDPKGVEFRESRDSDEHPNSTPIAVFFDVTGSMSVIPEQVQEKLVDLFSLLLRKGYVEDPQILVGAIGDATSDRVPLQVSQFESDNRIDDNLRNIFLEGNGGGQMSESYELAFYFLARHTVTDNFEKRGRKGYAFFIGDELARSVDRLAVKQVIGDELSESIPVEAILNELKEKWECFFIIPTQGTSHGQDPKLHEFWRKLFEQNLILVDNMNDICETIGAAIGLAEGTVDLESALEDLAEIGSSAGATVSKALATVGASKGVVSTSATPADLEGDSEAERL